jgi:hypothetical protein
LIEQGRKKHFGDSAGLVGDFENGPEDCKGLRAHLGESKDDCIFDVLATGGLEMAMLGAC